MCEASMIDKRHVGMIGGDNELEVQTYQWLVHRQSSHRHSDKFNHVKGGCAEEGSMGKYDVI